MPIFENVKRILAEEGINFIPVEEPSNVGFGFCSGVWLQIEGGCIEAPLYIEFSAMNKVFDLHFGWFSYELFEYPDECVLSELMKSIHAIMDGKTHIIWAWRTKSGRWHSDACYNIAPGEANDDSGEYRAVLRRIQRPRNMISRLLTRHVTYAIYNWHSYREITS